MLLTALNGAATFRTWVVPGSHRDPRNPRGPNDGIDERAPIPGEMQVSCPAGSVYVQDTRTWHAGATNQSQHERTAVVCRYAPWWLSSHEFGNLHSGGQHVRSYVPKECATLHQSPSVTNAAVLMSDSPKSVEASNLTLPACYPIESLPGAHRLCRHGDGV